MRCYGANKVVALQIKIWGYQLEEKGIYHPDNMLPNGEIDESIGIYSD